MTHILVTGGAGYIGSHTCKALAAKGHVPIAFDNLSQGHRESVRWGPLEIGDIADTSRLEAVFAQYRPHAVMHFAGSALVGESVIAPLKYYENNVSGTLNLLAAMLQHDVQGLVFSSTCAIYGEPTEDRIAESHPQNPINPYGASKQIVEMILNDCANAYAMRIIALRYFNAAGADVDGDIGEDHEPETHLIPRLLRAANGEQIDLEIHGADYETVDGTCVRDFIDVQDIADAHVLALGRVLEGEAGFSAYNLGTSRGHSVRQVIDCVARVTGRSLRVPVGPRRSGDPPTLVADASAIERDLGWTAHRSTLDDIIANAWRWERHRTAAAGVSQ